MALPPTDKRAATDEAFLREVDDAVRAGDLESFWNRFGRWLVAAVVIGLIAFGGWIYWQNQQVAAAEAQGESSTHSKRSIPDAGPRTRAPMQSAPGTSPARFGSRRAPVWS